MYFHDFLVEQIPNKINHNNKLLIDTILSKLQLRDGQNNFTLV